MRHHHPQYCTKPEGERGASAVEYALMLALIAVVVFSAVSFFGGSTSGGFGKSQSCISAAYDGTQMAANCGK